ncbi:ComF family protein [Prosthecomicrobium hirschii]|uniref:ComF family protein n=1 Tax=Prosthecodimorpha hirschii TaxID=665126 RepID=UPI0009F9BC75|nr:ComF family protein [Prosthecomicrobium hirschii]
MDPHTPIRRLFDRAHAGGGSGLVAGAARLFRRGLDFVLPPVCSQCRIPVAEPHSLCAGCWADLRLIERPYCERLGIPFGYDLGPGALSAEAIADPPPFDKARAAVLYEGMAAELVHRLKYQDRTELGRLIGRLTARAGTDLFPRAGLIVPVPLHPSRLLTRKFNQSQLIAAELGRQCGLPVDPLALARIKATDRQVGLNPRERAENVAGAFRVPPAAKARVAGMHILLVDDVLTTGATVKAATRALKRGGAAGVDVITFARVAAAGTLHI